MNENKEIIILHISDLHRTPGAELSNEELWEGLMHDIQNGYAATNKELQDIEPRLPDPNQIDVVVVSGDLTQQAKEQEFVQRPSDSDSDTGTQVRTLLSFHAAPWPSTQPARRCHPPRSPSETLASFACSTA